MKIFKKINRALGKAAFSKRHVPELPIQYFHGLSGAPVNDRSVYWIGHSLMQEVAKTPEGDISLFLLMERFCASKGIAYTSFEHTLFGAPLSMQWQGQPLSYERKAPEMDSKRTNFAKNASNFDTFVLTEVVPVREVVTLEYSAWYLQQYLRTIKKQSPSARVYLYESWDYLHGSRSPLAPELFDWKEAMGEQRALWEQMADMASQNLAFAPTLSTHLSVLVGKQPKVDKVEPIFIVPVGSGLVRLWDRLKAPLVDDDFRLADGSELKFYQLFSNAYKDWPEEWPLDKVCDDRDTIARRLSQLTLNDEDRELDDIHPSAIGIYFVALIQFATLYRQSPKGLAPLCCMSEGLALTLQNIAWQTVCADPRAGVSTEE